tara:strand:- start:1081 stop:1356 length:276 start_codon:yes stop_codon:yes gene_type:complete
MKRLKGFLIDTKFIEEKAEKAFGYRYYYDDGDKETLQLIDCTKVSSSEAQETIRMITTEDIEFVSIDDILKALVYKGILEPTHYLVEETKY